MQGLAGFFREGAGVEFLVDLGEEPVDIDEMLSDVLELMRHLNKNIDQLRLSLCANYTNQQMSKLKYYLAYVLYMMIQQSENRPIQLPLIYGSHKWARIRPLLERLTKSQSCKQSISSLRKLFTTMSEPDQESSSTAEIEAPLYQELVYQFQHIVPKLLKHMAEIVLFFQKIPPSLCLLYSGEGKQIDIAKSHILLLMSMMALNLTISACQHFAQFPSVRDFSWILTNEQFKTKTLVQYFIQEFKWFKKNKGELKNEPILSLIRRVSSQSIGQILQKNGHLKMCPPIIQNNKASIEDFFGALKVDFANMYIGGGALISGLVQEQIMFANHPEMYVSVLFCQKMSDNESINFIGFKKYWKNLGYSHTCKFEGPQQHGYSYDTNNRIRQYITAIDANCYFHSFDQSQFSANTINREILKAITGFGLSIGKNNKVATGNWGCGAFNGNVNLKFLIQWIACALIGKLMIYCPFGESQNLNKHKKLIDEISQLSVQSAYQLLIRQIKNVSHAQYNIFMLLELSIFK